MQSKLKPNKLKLGLTVLCIGLFGMQLSGCASLSKRECARGDWYGIGYADGQVGLLEGEFYEHREACADHGIPANSQAYGEGRQAGLRQYCTAVGGLRAGRAGYRYQGVCPEENLNEFIIGHELGYEIYLTYRQIDDMEEFLWRQYNDANYDCRGYYKQNTGKHRGYVNPHGCAHYYRSYYGFDYQRAELYRLEVRLRRLEAQASELVLRHVNRP